MPIIEGHLKGRRQLAIGVAAACCLALLAGGYAYTQHMATSQQLLVMPGTAFHDCVRAADPPACIVAKAASIAGVDSQELLEAIVETGAVELVEQNRAALVDGAQSELSASSSFLSAVGVQTDLETEQIGDAPSRVVIAAVALAAAAQLTDDPLSDRTVMSLTAGSRGDIRIPQIAIALWHEIDTYSEWSSPLTRPRGIERIWDAILARPPADNRVLSELATMAAFSSTSRDYGVPLLRVLTSRADASANTKAEAASLLARVYHLADEAQRLMSEGGREAPGYDRHGIEVEISEARLRGSSNQEAAQVVLSDRLHDLSMPAFQSYLNPAPLDALEAGGARTQLRNLGDAYLQRARQRSGGAEDTGQWFALASDCFRRAGDTPAALSAAREGLQFVATAVAARHGSTSRAGPRTSLESQRAAAQATDFGAEPVLALYRAGARGEAMSFGYLSGYQRYRAASPSDGPIDAQAIVDDRSWFYLQIISRSLISDARTEWAEQLYRTLGNSRSQFPDVSSDDFQRQLGLMAALTGRASEMRSHFSEAAEALDRTPSESKATTASYALALAAEWRRGEQIIARVRAAGVRR